MEATEFKEEVLPLLKNKLPEGFTVRVGVVGGPRSDGPRFLGIARVKKHKTDEGGFVDDVSGKPMGAMVLTSRGGQREPKEVADELDQFISNLAPYKPGQTIEAYGDSNHSPKFQNEENVDTTIRPSFSSGVQANVVLHADGTFSMTNVPSHMLFNFVRELEGQEINVRVS